MLNTRKPRLTRRNFPWNIESAMCASMVAERYFARFDANSPTYEAAPRVVWQEPKAHDEFFEPSRHHGRAADCRSWHTIRIGPQRRTTSPSRIVSPGSATGIRLRGFAVADRGRANHLPALHRSADDGRPGARGRRKSARDRH